MPWLDSQLCPAHRRNICHQVLLTSYSRVVELFKVLEYLVLIELDDVKYEARSNCHCRALSTFCLFTELGKIHATPLIYPLFRVRSWNNGVCCMSFYILMSLTLPFISQAEPPPQFVWLLSLLNHHHKFTCDGNSLKSRGSRMSFTKLEYTSSKFSGWDWYDLLFRGYCQACSLEIFWHMRHQFQSWEWDLPLLVDAIAASHYLM